MAKQYDFNTVHANGARNLFNERGLQLQAVTLADVTSLNWEGTSGAAPVTIQYPIDNRTNATVPVRTLTVYSKADIWIAGSVLAVGTVASQKLAADRGGADRFFVPANTLRELPWYWDEVFVQAVGGGGAFYVEGKV